ncbi:MAG TPA: T9SS type A sorting domain-containing protein [bacterium]|jgi:hypothetical protein
MKISKTLLFALFSLALAGMAFGQGSISIAYSNDNGNPPLGYPCAIPRTAFAQGTIIAIYWDANGNGPDDTDVQPVVSPDTAANFNTQVINGEDMGIGGDGYFLFDGYFQVTILPEVPRYYLQISRPDPNGVCWQSDVFTLVQGPQEWLMTPAEWHCVGTPCHVTGTVPAAPTNVTATVDTRCLSVQLSWQHPLTNESGFNIYADGIHVYTANPDSLAATLAVITEGPRSYYVTAINNVGESDTSNHAVGSTYLVRLNDDTLTNVHGDSLHGRTVTVWFNQPPDTTPGPCDFSADIWLLRDISPSHIGTWARFGTAPIAHDSSTDSMSVILPNDTTINFCRLLLVDSSYGAAVTYTDTTDSVFHLGNPFATGLPGFHSVAPSSFDLAQNYPNPFNPTTQIEFSVPVQAEIRIKVYNIMGQAVRTLVQGTYPAGIHKITWDGKSDAGISVGSGVYIYRMEGQKFTQVKKMLLMK